MQAWTLVSGRGESADPLDDPEQRVQPKLEGAGPGITWLPADGHVARHSVAGFKIKYNDGGFKTVAEIPGKEVDLYITDRRMVLVVPDVDPGSGSAGWVADMLTGGAAATVRDWGRAVGGALGVREKFHVVWQVDYVALAFVRYYEAKMWGARSLLDVAAYTGDSAPRVLEIVETSFSRKASISSVAADIFSRARRVQARNDFGILDQAKLRTVAAASFKPNRDAHIGTLGDSCISLNVLHERTVGGRQPDRPVGL